MIGKGHDGPARKGKLQFDEDFLHTPFIVGPSGSLYSDMIYGNKNYFENSFFLQSTGSQVSGSLIDAEPRTNTLFLLPSLLGINALSSATVTSYLRSQLAFYSNSDLEASTVVPRIPSTLSMDDIASFTEEIENLGITAVSFTFDGSFGPSDLRNLQIRAQLPHNLLIIALGRISPSLLPVLYYAGFDVFDSGYAFEASSLSMRLWELDTEIIDSSSKRRFCPCEQCQALNKKKPERSEAVKALEIHNSALYRQVLTTSVHLASVGNLRWFVESRSHASPGLAAFVRMMDTSIYTYLEEMTPNHVDESIPFIGPESYNSPIARRFRERVRERYIPNPAKKIVLLLPCSARKPYSDSRSHRRFIDVLERTVGNKRDAIAETIITSPLGLVPRELERIYPAGNYDIPVTGDWDAEETTIAAEALVFHLQKFPEDAVVVAHVSGGYLDVVKEAQDRVKQSMIYTSPDTSVSKKGSLDALRDTLSDLMDNLDLSTKRTSLEDTVRATADFMFGIGAGESLVPDGAKVGGKVYGSIITRIKGEQTCVYAGPNGKISLTLEGGRRLAPLKRSWVQFDGNTIEGSSIFAIGISSADPLIRPGDEVIILSKDGDVVGVGKSEMSGREMCEFRNGLAVKVRHKEK